MRRLLIVVVTLALAVVSDGEVDYKSMDLKTFISLAEGGNAEAQFKLGLEYANLSTAKRKDISPDFSEADKWLRKASDQGDPAADAALGILYAQAMSDNRGKANQGDAVAQQIMGKLCYEAPKTLQNYKEAAKWYSKSAEQGNSNAQIVLGSMYFEGKGLAQDFVSAYKWSNLSCAYERDPKNRECYVKIRDAILAKMSPAQITEGQKQAKEWQEQFDKKQARK